MTPAKNFKDFNQVISDLLFESFPHSSDFQQLAIHKHDVPEMVVSRWKMNIFHGSAVTPPFSCTVPFLFLFLILDPYRYKQTLLTEEMYLQLTHVCEAECPEGQFETDGLNGVGRARMVMEDHTVRIYFDHMEYERMIREAMSMLRWNCYICIFSRWKLCIFSSCFTKIITIRLYKALSSRSCASQSAVGAGGYCSLCHENCCLEKQCSRTHRISLPKRFRFGKFSLWIQVTTCRVVGTE